MPAYASMTIRGFLGGVPLGEGVTEDPAMDCFVTTFLAMTC